MEDQYMQPQLKRLIGQIKNNEVHVWVIDLNETEKQQKLYSFLSPDEKIRASFFAVEWARQQYTITRGALRSILSRYIASSPESIDIKYGKYGKPYCSIEQNNLNLKFNISHSADVALCAVAKDIQVGVDIEKILPKESLADLSETVFTRNEQKVISYLGQNSHESFFECWTYKEAYVKAMGSGLSMNLKDLDISEIFMSQGGLLIDKDKIKWRFVKLPFEGGYHASLVLEGNIERIFIYQFSV